jgi:hypothetical protein
MTLNLLIDTLGWLGAAALLVASVPYQVLNVVGSIGLIMNTVYYGAYPSTFVNVVWIAIAAYTLLRVWAARAA